MEGEGGRGWKERDGGDGRRGMEGMKRRGKGGSEMGWGVGRAGVERGDVKGGREWRESGKR